jgi:hypothetical protein
MVGGIPTPLKNMLFSWDDYSQLNGQIKHVLNHQPVFMICQNTMIANGDLTANIG